jgi:hypothetical protein
MQASVLSLFRNDDQISFQPNAVESTLSMANEGIASKVGEQVGEQTDARSKTINLYGRFSASFERFHTKTNDKGL